MKYRNKKGQFIKKQSTLPSLTLLTAILAIGIAYMVNLPITSVSEAQATTWRLPEPFTEEEIKEAHEKYNESLIPLTVEDKIRKYAKEYGVDEHKALDIAWCESRFDPKATNWQGSTAKGTYQFTDPTWKWIGAKGHQFDEDENIKQFMKWYQVYPTWWACNK